MYALLLNKQKCFCKVEAGMAEPLLGMQSTLSNLGRLNTVVFLFFDFTELVYASVFKSLPYLIVLFDYSTYIQTIYLKLLSVCSSMSTTCKANSTPCATQCKVRLAPNIPYITLIILL